jgi:hypothetical protein
LQVRVDAIQHPYRASGDIVEDAFAITNENDFNLPNQQYLQRAANRIRQKLRPAEPKDLTFEVLNHVMKIQTLCLIYIVSLYHIGL